MIDTDTEKAGDDIDEEGLGVDRTSFHDSIRLLIINDLNIIIRFSVWSVDVLTG